MTRGAKKFKFKYNPIDISSIYLYDEDKDQYIEIPNADPEFGSISLEEYNYLRKVLLKHQFKTDTTTIMKAHADLLDLIGGAITEKRRLLRGQKKASSRAHDLEVHPPTSQKRRGALPEETKAPWVPTQFEIKVKK